MATSSPMKFGGCDNLFDYWETSLKFPSSRAHYFFQIHALEESIFYHEIGFSHFPPLERGQFKFPYLCEADAVKVPEWAKSTVWYEIFPDRFRNGDPTLNPPDCVAWGSAAPTANNRFGGDLQGIIDSLPYLSKLGINGLYLCPIFQSPSNHKYDVVNFLEIDEQFGSKKKFKELVEKCHKKGIKVMLDAVFNHCGEQFPPFLDLLKNQEKSKYKDWFFVHSFPVQSTPKPNYQTFSFYGWMPKLNTSNPETRDFLISVGEYWIKEFDIDGWRLDVANEIDRCFWREFVAKVKKIKPEIFIVGEMWHNALPWLQGDQFHSCMNYPLAFSLFDWISPCTAKCSDNLSDCSCSSPRAMKCSATEFALEITKMRYWYPDPINEVMFNIVGSHDTPRLFSRCHNDIKKVFLAVLFLMTFPGSPCVYYGGCNLELDEIGMTGKMDPDCRKCMNWNSELQNCDLFKYFQKLISLKKKSKALQVGKISFLAFHDDQQYIIYKRETLDETVVVVISVNCGSVEVPEFEFMTGKRKKNMVTEEIFGEHEKVRLEGVSGVCLEIVGTPKPTVEPS